MCLTNDQHNLKMNNFLKTRCLLHVNKCLNLSFKSNTIVRIRNNSLSLHRKSVIKTFIPMSFFTFCQVREYAKKAQGKMAKGGRMKAQQLSDEEMADVIDIVDYKEQLNNVVDKLKKDYVEHVSVRSIAGNIDKILVKIGDEEYPLNELAVISKKNPNLIAINMVDFPEGLKPAIQAILDCGAGLNPQQEGTMIYVSVPKVTREYRENLAKSAKILFVKAKDEVRAIQNYYIKEAKGKTELSEDLVFSATNQIKAMADQCSAELEKTMKTKQKELLGDS